MTAHPAPISRSRKKETREAALAGGEPGAMATPWIGPGDEPTLQEGAPVNDESPDKKWAASAEDEIAALDRALEGRWAGLETASERYVELRQALAEQTAHGRELAVVLSERISDLDNLLGQVSALRADVTAKDARVLELTGELRVLQEEVRVKDARVLVLQERLTDERQARTNADEEARRCRAALVDESGERQAVTAERDSLQHELETVTSRAGYRFLLRMERRFCGSPTRTAILRLLARTFAGDRRGR